MNTEMQLKNELCEICITVDNSYVIDSKDNARYDIVYNPDNHREFYKVFSIEIFNNSKDMKIALVGDCYSCDENCAILDGNILTILQNDVISQINVITGELVFYTNIEDFGCNFGIYEIETEYIIYGEIEIKMLDFNFNTKWKFSGRDIFVSVSGKNSFELCKDRIKLYDFNDDYYEIDFNGNELI